eukprot:1019645_1
MRSFWLLLVLARETTSLTLLDIDGLLTTTDINNIAIGWLKVGQCAENDHWIYQTPFIDLHSVIDLLPYAISLKLVPVNNELINVDDFELETTVCSNPIYNLNHAKELSFTTDMTTGLITGYVDNSNWIGTTTAKLHLDNNGYSSFCEGYGLEVGDAPRNFSKRLYGACQADHALYIPMSLDCTKYICCKWWFNSVGEEYNPDMVMWLGFDPQLNAFCKEDGDRNYVLTANTITPSTNPSETPSIHPSESPFNDPTDYPTDTPSNSPTHDPSNSPTQYRTRVSETTDNNENSKEESDVSISNEGDMMVIIAVVLGTLTVIVLFLVSCICFWSKRSKDLEHNQNNLSQQPGAAIDDGTAIQERVAMEKNEIGESNMIEERMDSMEQNEGNVIEDNVTPNTKGHTNNGIRDDEFVVMGDDSNHAMGDTADHDAMEITKYI